MEETVNVQTVVQYWEAASRFDIFMSIFPNGGVWWKTRLWDISWPEHVRYGCLATIRMCEDWLAVNLLSHLPDHPARFLSHWQLYKLFKICQILLVSIYEPFGKLNTNAYNMDDAAQAARSSIFSDGFSGRLSPPLCHASKNCPHLHLVPVY